jgi:hypothetical protein
MELQKDENGWYLPGNGYSVVISMEVFNVIHSEEFNNQYPQLTEKIMMQGLDSLNEEETSILARYTG